MIISGGVTQQRITATISASTSGGISDPVTDNDFLLGVAGKWVSRTLAQVKTILGLGTAAYTDTTAYAAASHTHTQGQVTSLPFQEVTFANPLNLDATTNKDFKVFIEGDATINLNNMIEGDAGMIELQIDSSGGYTLTLGSMFLRKLGTTNQDTAAGKINYITWRCVATNTILYTIDTVQ